MRTRPRDFDELIHILDLELRLITPTDPEGSDWRRPAAGPVWSILPAHPRLSGPLAARVGDPQAKGDPARPGGTAAGRTVGVWNAKPENRRLPSALEWANIRMLTSKPDWSEPQGRMMKRGGKSVRTSLYAHVRISECRSPCRTRRSPAGRRQPKLHQGSGPGPGALECRHTSSSFHCEGDARLPHLGRFIPEKRTGAAARGFTAETACQPRPSLRRCLPGRLSLPPPSRGQAGRGFRV